MKKEIEKKIKNYSSKEMDSLYKLISKQDDQFLFMEIQKNSQEKLDFDFKNKIRNTKIILGIILLISLIVIFML